MCLDIVKTIRNIIFLCEKKVLHQITSVNNNILLDLKKQFMHNFSKKAL